MRCALRFYFVIFLCEVSCFPASFFNGIDTEVVITADTVVTELIKMGHGEMYFGNISSMPTL